MSAKTTKPAKRRALAKAATPVALPLLADLRRMILQARESVARTVDAGLTALYWHIGRRMLQDVLKYKPTLIMMPSTAGDQGLAADFQIDEYFDKVGWSARWLGDYREIRGPAGYRCYKLRAATP